MANTFRRLTLTTFSVVAFMSTAGAMDNAHSYKPPTMYGTSPTCWFVHDRGHDTKSWLSKFDVSYQMGNTRTSWNDSGHSTGLFNATGPANMLAIGENVAKLPSTYMTNFANFIALNPNLLIGKGSASDFGKLTFNGKFSLMEVDLSWRQNLIKGFFLEFGLPIRDLRFTDITKTDLSPETGNGGFNQARAEWKQLKNNLDKILDNYGFKPLATRYKKTGTGDLSTLAGWEKIWEIGVNEQYVGLTVKAGAIFPTSPEQDPSYVFSLPLGYDRNIGLLGFGQLQAGLLSWLSVRAHGSGTYFVKGDKKDYRMKTFSGQNGWLKLAKGKAEMQEGVLWHLGADVAADHVDFGVSARIGYSYNQQENAKLTPADTTLFPTATVNSDTLLRAWHQHVLHFMLDWDASVLRKLANVAPRISAFYNMPIKGENAFKTDTFGGSVGLDIRWKI